MGVKFWQWRRRTGAENAHIERAFFTVFTLKVDVVFLSPTFIKGKRNKSLKEILLKNLILLIFYFKFCFYFKTFYILFCFCFVFILSHFIF